MPTYDYVCDACEHEFELFQQMSDPVKRKCPACAKLKLRRLIGAGAGVIFKGSGFYETDYRSDSYKKSADADKKASSGDGGKKSEKGDKSKNADAPAAQSGTSESKKTGDSAKSSPGKASKPNGKGSSGDG